MKKIIVLATAMCFALAWSSIRADAMTKMSGGMSGPEINNGVTDFSGRTYDSLSILPGEATSGWIEHEAAGGYRGEAEATVLSNGITDFSGKTYDSPTTGPVSAAGGWVESSSAGGYREEGMNKRLYNGVTDFSGCTYDSL